MNLFSPFTTTPTYHTTAAAALEAVQRLYAANTEYLRTNFHAFTKGTVPVGRVSACYPSVAITTDKQTQVDPRLAYGFVPAPGRYETTLTRPDLFGRYYLEQFTRLLQNHAEPLEVGISTTPIPIHFAYETGITVEDALGPDHIKVMRDYFDTPNLAHMNDSIVNGTYIHDDVLPLAPFTAARVDYSLHRLRHYTATNAEDFQNFIIFTNYQFYVDEFQNIARGLVGTNGYTAFVEPTGARLPQMPAYHLQRADASGITLINIGVGPSNAKTITDHVAVLRPHAWLMLGHCAGLRAAQRMGDYVLAHAYVREDGVLDEDLPTWVPIPALAEIQTALERAVAEVTGLSGYDAKSIMRTGTVHSTANRNWELLGEPNLHARLSQSRAIALDMESAAIAANGYRFRVPYGTLLCISDKPLHGEIKLPGMADKFYRERVDQHLKIGIRTMEMLAATPQDQLHSRKLRSFVEAAFQ